MSVILNLVPEKDMIAFSSNYNPTTSSLLDQLFPNEKTSNLVATYQTVKKDQFAEMAEVHAFNTEAKIATRAPFSEKEIKKFITAVKLISNLENKSNFKKFIIKQKIKQRHKGSQTRKIQQCCKENGNHNLYKCPLFTNTQYIPNPLDHTITFPC